MTRSLSVIGRLLSTSTIVTNQTGIPTHLLRLHKWPPVLHPCFRRVFRAYFSVILDPDDLPSSAHAHGRPAHAMSYSVLSKMGCRSCTRSFSTLTRARPPGNVSFLQRHPPKGWTSRSSDGPSSEGRTGSVTARPSTRKPTPPARSRSTSR